MANHPTSNETWARVAGATGLAGITCYFGAAFIPLPDAAVRLLAFAFGPFLCAAFAGLYRYLSEENDGPILQLASVFGILAGAMVTTMLVVQVGNNMVRAELLAEAGDESVRESIKLSWGAVNRVQYLLDVVWDIFICVATMLLGVVLWSHARFGRIWGGLGFLAGFLLLAFNLYTFPYAPAEVGSVDLGPFVAMFMLGVFVRLLLPKRS